MTTWSVIVGDILDQPADILVCSANPFLTLSGGVGGAFLLRYGPEMQTHLQAYLHARGVRHVPPGTVVQMPPCGSPYRAVLHAVAVDGFYESSAELITNVVQQILTLSVTFGGHTVALPAVATGYGHLQLADFAAGLRPCLRSTPGPARVLICLIRLADAALVSEVLGLEL